MEVILNLNMSELGIRNESKGVCDFVDIEYYIPKKLRKADIFLQLSSDDGLEFVRMQFKKATNSNFDQYTLCENSILLENGKVEYRIVYRQYDTLNFSSSVSINTSFDTWKGFYLTLVSDDILKEFRKGLQKVRDLTELNIDISKGLQEIYDYFQSEKVVENDDNEC